MEPIYHKLTKTEVSYGIIVMRMSDGTSKLFSNLPPRFNIVLTGTKLDNRQISVRNVWIGFGYMKKFAPGTITKMYRKNNTIFIEEHT